MNKKTIRRRQKEFHTIINSFLKENAVETSGLYKWRIGTTYGELQLTTHEESDREAEVYSVFTRFIDLDRAIDIPAPTLNKFSGKWNFHMLVENNDPFDFANNIISQIKRIM